MPEYPSGNLDKSGLILPGDPRFRWSPSQVNALHSYDDVDLDLDAHHHTLGNKATQAARGNHSHDIIAGYFDIQNPGGVIITGANTDLPNTGFTITKRSAITDLVIFSTISAYSNVVAPLTTYVKINGVVTYIGSLFYNITATHMLISGMRKISGVAAGTFSANLGAIQATGVGTGQTDANDYHWAIVYEVDKIT